MKGHGATTSLQSLLQVTEQVDALVGFQDNKSKKQVAATPSTQQRVNQATPAGFPQCCAQLRVLGEQRRAVLRPEYLEKVHGAGAAHTFREPATHDAVCLPL